MPFQDISADQISAGAFSDAYTISGAFTVGNTATAHVVIGSDSHGANGVRLYGADGITPLIDLNITSPFVAGSVVSGPVASATSATTATNLAGGGSAAGTTTITGALIVGNPATAHVVVGSDANGADGVRIYGSDGVTALIDLTISGTPTITSAVFQTAAAGTRLRIGGTTGASPEFDFYTSNADFTPAILDWGITTNGGVPGGPTSAASYLGIASARTGSGPTLVGRAAIDVVATSPDGLVNDHVIISAGGPIILGQLAGGAAEPGSQLIVRVGYPTLGVMSYDGATLAVSGTVTVSDAGGAGITVSHRAAGDGLVFPADSGNSPGVIGPLGQALGLVETLGHFLSDSAAGDIAAIAEAGKSVRLGIGQGNNTSVIVDQFGGLGLCAVVNGGAQTVGTGRIYGGSGVPIAGRGVNGDFYFRMDTPGTANQRLYVKSAGAWVGIV